MEHTDILTGNTGENHFETINDFKECMRYHGEVEFEWKGTLYTITHPEGMINISGKRKNGARRRTKPLNI